MAKKLSAMQKWQRAQKEQRGGNSDNVERFKINGGEKRFTFNPGGNNGR